jgi:16S rRNA (uracil1498-N3)-methyltransferase
MNSFYVPQLKSFDKEITLSEEESKHACRVLRLKINDIVELLDGLGGIYQAKIIEDHPKRCKLEIVSFDLTVASNYQIHLAIAPTKNLDRIEWLVEKVTEIGVTELTFIIGDHSERKEIKLERVEKILVAAMKQSKRSYLPILNPVVTVKEFLNKFPLGALAHCEVGEKKQLSEVIKSENYPILIGPEGDFSKNEINLASEKGYDFISLGTNRLRTETAGLFACVQAKLCLDVF